MTKSIWCGLVAFVLGITVLQGVVPGIAVTIALSVLAALNTGGKGVLARLAAVVIVLGIAVWAVYVHPWLLAVPVVAAAAWLALAVYRVKRAGPGAWRHIPLMLWAAWRQLSGPFPASAAWSSSRPAST